MRTSSRTATASSRRRSDLYREIEPRVKERSAEEAAEITEAFEQLEAAMPSGERARRIRRRWRMSSEAAQLVGAELEETVGAKPVEESDPAAVQAEIERLLDEIVETYDPANPDPAAELAAEAYLQNYETIEAGVIEAAPDGERRARAAARRGAAQADPRGRLRARRSRRWCARAKQLLAQARQGAGEQQVMSRAAIRACLAALAALLALRSLPAAAGAQGFSKEDAIKELNKSRDEIERSVELYQRRQAGRGLQAARNAYLDHFEFVEIPLRVQDEAHDAAARGGLREPAQRDGGGRARRRGRRDRR